MWLHWVFIEILLKSVVFEKCWCTINVTHTCGSLLKNQPDVETLLTKYLLNTTQYVTQHIEKDQLDQKSKLDSMLFSKWLLFQLNFGAKSFEIEHCLLKLWQFYGGDHNWLVKSWFLEKKALQIWESVQSIGIWAVQRSISTWKQCFYTKLFK